MTTKHACWIAAIMTMLLISFLSNIPYLVFFNNNLPPAIHKLISQYSLRFGGTGFFSYAISLQPDYLIHKAGHILLYGLLGSLLYKAVGRSYVWAILLVALFAISDELHQSFVPGRSCRLGDVILNTLSAAAFIYAAHRKEKKLCSRDVIFPRS